MTVATPTGFEAWARLRRPTIVSWVRRRGPGLPEEDCEDIASEVMLAVCRLHLRRQLRGQTPPDHEEMDRYSNGVIRNCVIEWRRRPRGRAMSLPDDEEPAGLEDLTVEDRHHRNQVHRLVDGHRSAMPEVLSATWDRLVAQATGGEERSTPLTNTERGQLGRLKIWLLRLIREEEPRPAATQPLPKEDEE